jgi:RNA polymerase sigma-70 factor (ECF subfamily)
LGEQIYVEPAVASAASERTLSLAQRILERDPSAEQELVTTYRRGVLAIATARTRDREVARDLTQDVLLAVLEALRKGKLQQPDKLSAYINGVARNLINHYLVSRVRHSECELDDECYTTDPVEELEAGERKRLVRSELAALGAVDRQILLLSLVDGHSLAEVALRLNLSHEAVRKRKSRAIKRITKKFMRMSHP